MGKQDNCQVAVSLSVANEHACLPVAWRLYLPQAWAEDAARRGPAGVPDALGFATKPQIALRQLRTAQADGIPPGIVLADAGYGVDTDFRDGITALGLAYVVGTRLPRDSHREPCQWRPGHNLNSGRVLAAGRGGDGEHSVDYGFLAQRWRMRVDCFAYIDTHRGCKSPEWMFLVVWNPQKHPLRLISLMSA